MTLKEAVAELKDKGSDISERAADALNEAFAGAVEFVEQEDGSYYAAVMQSEDDQRATDEGKARNDVDTG